ncbi:integumentary mucin C.1 [Galleria mellonella]|uniref:Integumentary mucin C.1 n=1 Tax=Galleria mellonella TaxID=7137 RepID=A0ABM3MD94_GALME|nr:integumentary mucin C.1 [Galleria mellonella]
MNIRNMKVWAFVFCLSTSIAAPVQQPAPLVLDIIDMAAISRMSPQQLEILAEGLAAEEIMRTKRSSAQALTSVVSKASSASSLQGKIGLLGQASAGAATLIASASSKTGHDSHDHGYSYEPHEEKYDYWGLKKSILYTLFQAVKAITGGVTILKGQLIKGGGALASTLGKVISVKGDAVSHLGKKIVSSAALVEKKPSGHVYGPPPAPPAHVEYGPPTGYGAPTAPAHFTHTGPAAPTGFAAHKYPAHLDGRDKLNGVHAGVLLLTPLGDAVPSQTQEAPSIGHTPLEPPPSILHKVYSAIKNVFSSAAPEYAANDNSLVHHPPPPPQPVPPFKPMTWGAVNSYGEPAMADAYSDYDPRNPHPPFEQVASKKSITPHVAHKVQQGLTPAKIQKIKRNLNKLAMYMNEHIHRSSEDLPTFTGLEKYKEMIKKGQVPLFPTSVVTDDEIGVLPAEFLPSDTLTTTSTPTSSTTTKSTTISSTVTTTTTKTTTKTNTTTNNNNRSKDAKYYLRGNRIVQV